MLRDKRSTDYKALATTPLSGVAVTILIKLTKDRMGLAELKGHDWNIMKMVVRSSHSLR